MRKLILILWAGILSVFSISCYDDEGSNDYHPINEVKISDWKKGGYTAIFKNDTLKITPLSYLDTVRKEPVIQFTEDSDPSRYEYEWKVVASSLTDDRDKGIVLGTERNLRYFVNLKPDSYTLYLKVKDTKTDLIWKSYTSLTVLSVTDKGFFVLGEKEDGTGDYGDNGSENRLYRSADDGETWELVGQYSQDWRAIGICFTEDALLWGTDAGSCSDTVHFVRMDRKTRKIEIIQDFEGPCHGCASFAGGRAFFSTGVEGGENEKDRYSRMKEYHDGRCENVWKLEKDCWPLIVQYGVMRFPLGTDMCNHVVFTTMGLKGYGECVMIEDK